MPSLIKTSDILDVSSVRKSLKAKTGRDMWRSMNELAGTPAFKKYLDVEFPVAADANDVDRRNFIKLMGASMALAGVTGCTKQPTEHIVPYVNQPESMIPGRPLFFASALPMGGFGRGVLVESHMGRPTKIEGNPDHPGSLGASDVWMQARILEMYDPDRSQVVKHRGRISTWDHFLAKLKPKMDALVAKEGQGLRILTGDISSPTLSARIASLKAKYPKAGWHSHEPVSHDANYRGTELAFGEKLEAQYDLKDADVVLTVSSRNHGHTGDGVDDLLDAVAVGIRPRFWIFWIQQTNQPALRELGGNQHQVVCRAARLRGLVKIKFTADNKIIIAATQSDINHLEALEFDPVVDFHGIIDITLGIFKVIGEVHHQ